MNSGSITKKVKYMLTLFVLILFGTSSFAASNSVSSVNIKQNPSGEYRIILKTDKAAKIKKSVEGNKLMLTVSSALPSGSAEIIYDNVPGIQNVTVQKKNSENTLITMQGDNVKNALIFNKDLSTGKIKAVKDNNAFFIIADKKLFAYSMISMLFLFFFALISRPKEKRYSENTAVKRVEAARKSCGLTLREKARLQSANVPSVNSKMSGSFVSSSVTMPSDFTAETEEYTERIRKAG